MIADVGFSISECLYDVIRSPREIENPPPPNFPLNIRMFGARIEMSHDPKDRDFRDLLGRIARGSHKAFAELYDLFWPELLSHVLAKVRDVQAAEDILHDMFVSLWNRRETILEIESIPAYFYTSCRYLVFRHYRRRMQEEHPDEELDVADQERPLEERLHYRYLLDMVAREVEKLPEKCRQAFKLSRYEYLTNREIAERMAISESTVENHINKAINRLRLSAGKDLKFFQLFF